MRIAYLLITIFGVGLFLGSLPSSVGVSLFQAFTLGPCFFALLILFLWTFITGLAKWRKTSRWWMGPALFCVALIFFNTLAFKLVGGDWQFKHHKDDYVKIVNSIQSGAIPCSSTIDIINVSNLPPHIGNVRAMRCADGAVLIIFMGNGGCALGGHAGYIFKGYSETNDCIPENMRPEHFLQFVYHIQGSWYGFSD